MNVSQTMASNERRRRIWRNICAAGATLSAAMFGVSVASVLGASALPPGTAPTPGFTISPTSGDSTTEIDLTLASPNNVCPGDTATGNFRWQTYLTPISVDAATLTYNSQGPIKPAAAPNTYPLYAFIGQGAIINRNTAVTTGQITGTSTVGLGVFSATDLPAGQYRLGYACSKPPAPGQAAQTERYWQQIITISAPAAGSAAAFSWTVAAPVESTTTTTVAPTSTTTTTTTVPGGNTTTTVARATTTTTAGATTTTTTVAGATTTTSTTVAGATTSTSSTSSTSSTTTTTTAVASGGPISSGSGSSSFPASGSGSSSGFNAGSGGALPVTGRDELPVIVWGILLVVFGRMAVLLARPVKVIPAGHA